MKEKRKKIEYCECKKPIVTGNSKTICDFCGGTLHAEERIRQQKLAKIKKIDKFDPYWLEVADKLGKRIVKLEHALNSHLEWHREQPSNVTYYNVPTQTGGTPIEPKQEYCSCKMGHHVDNWCIRCRKPASPLPTKQECTNTKEEVREKILEIIQNWRNWESSQDKELVEIILEEINR
jgi:hypothetical protein